MKPEKLRKRPFSKTEIAEIEAVETSFEDERMALFAEAGHLTAEEGRRAIEEWLRETYEERRALGRLKREVFLQKNFPHRYAQGGRATGFPGGNKE